ncbi:MAG: hypothetical protein AAF846_22675, partial [Chloroflexota bacterium]
EEVYTTLKAEYPDLPIFATICAISVETNNTAQLINAGRQVAEYSDIVGLSIYPYLLGDIGLRGRANPQNLPDNWLSRWVEIDPEKPFAITETAYIAEDLSMPDFGISISGTEEYQANYVERLLYEAQLYNAEFVIWFIVRDYDAFVITIEGFGIEAEAFLIWRDTGLFDEQGRPRPALAIWDSWLTIPQSSAR